MCPSSGISRQRTHRTYRPSLRTIATQGSADAAPGYAAKIVQKPRAIFAGLTRDGDALLVTDLTDDGQAPPDEETEEGEKFEEERSHNLQLAVNWPISLLPSGVSISTRRQSGCAAKRPTSQNAGDGDRAPRRASNHTMQAAAVGRPRN